MNVHVTKEPVRTTQAAEGLPRRAWTVDELLRLVETGIIDEDERFELIGGEIVPMSPKGYRHENVKSALVLHLARLLPDDLTMAIETTLYVDDITFFEPDIIVWPKCIKRIDRQNDVTLPDLSLLVEVADTSLAKDLHTKAASYSSFGVREYWFVNAQNLVTTVHREPTESGFGTIQEFAYTDLVSPALAPTLAVRLADLELEPAKD